MRTTITIDDTLFADLMKLTEAKSRSEAVRQAISDWVRRQRIERLKKLRGKLELDVDIDEMRRLDIEELRSLNG